MAGTNADPYVPCEWDNCLEYANTDEQDHIFDGMLCPRHIDEAMDEHKASTHYQESDK